MLLKVLIYVSMANSVLSNTGSTESVVKYVGYRLQTIAAILDNDESCPTADRSNIGQSNNNNNNNNNQDNVYGAVIMAEPLPEFTRFI